MKKLWLIHREYSDAGIRWSGSLRGSSRIWAAVTPWGNETAIEERLIVEWAELVLGPTGTIQTQHVRCGAAGKVTGVVRLIFERSGVGEVSVVVENGDRSAALRELLALAILQSDRAKP